MFAKCCNIVTMLSNYFSFGVYVLILSVNAEDKIKNILVKVLPSNCTANGNTECSNRYLQVCYHNTNVCGRKMSIDCLLPPDYNREKTYLKAEDGSSFAFIYTDKIADITNVIIGITKTSKTSPHPLAMSCEVERNQTANGFRIKTRSFDNNIYDCPGCRLGIPVYNYTNWLGIVCTNPNCTGHTCDICGNGYPSTTKTTRTTTVDGSLTKLTTTITRDRTIAYIHSKPYTNKGGNVYNTRYVLTSSTRAARFSPNVPGNVNNQPIKTITGILIANTFILVVVSAIMIVGIVIFVRKSNKITPEKKKGKEDKVERPNIRTTPERFVINHVSTEVRTTELMIPSGTNSPPAEVSTQ